MKAKQAITQVFELDGDLLCREGETLRRIDDLSDVSGDKQLVTDFQEGMSRVMTVEGPVKFAELLVRRKLQETGEFEEPIHIFTHWKKKRGKSAADVFFTAVPSRLSRYYLGELAQQSDITLVYAMYGVLWDQIKRSAARDPVAVILRHHRFAEIVVGSKTQVYFANRCVAFDTEKEQINALWETVKSDLEAVENEQRIKIAEVIHLNWVDTPDKPDQWPDQWQQRLVTAEQEAMRLETQPMTLSWALVSLKQKAVHSVSAFNEKLFYLAKHWAPAINAGLTMMALALIIGFISFRADAYRLEKQIEDVQDQIGRVQTKMPRQVLSEDFEKVLKFVGQLEQNRNTPSYQQIVDDLTQTALTELVLAHLKVDMGSDRIRVELSGNIDAPFEVAHGGYQAFLNQMTARGYHVEESRFETQINTSQVALKLSRPVI